MRASRDYYRSSIQCIGRVEAMEFGSSPMGSVSNPPAFGSARRPLERVRIVAGPERRVSGLDRIRSEACRIRPEIGEVIKDQSPGASNVFFEFNSGRIEFDSKHFEFDPGAAMSQTAVDRFLLSER